jgi:hypothetical protein
MTRYDELVSLVLDGEPEKAELAELEQMLRADEQRARDFREQLLVWEAWSQADMPERTEGAFIASLRTRLRAEEDATEFERSVLKQFRERKNPFLLTPLVSIAAVMVIVLSLIALFRPAAPDPAETQVELVSISGESV